MPNVMVIEKKWENGVEVKKTQSGLIVRIRDGCVISWDGTSIRHCMSIRMDPKNPERPFGCPKYGYVPLKSDFFHFTMLIHLQL